MAWLYVCWKWILGTSLEQQIARKTPGCPVALCLQTEVGIAIALFIKMMVCCEQEENLVTKARGLYLVKHNPVQGLGKSSLFLCSQYVQNHGPPL